MRSLCQGLDLGVVAGTFCAFAPPVRACLGRAVSLPPSAWLSLQVPVSVLLGGLGLSLAWRAALLLPGIYTEQQPSRSAPVSYALRCLISLNGCTAVSGAGYQLLRMADPWHAMVGFWVSSFVLLTLVRCLLLLCTGTERRSTQWLSRRTVLIAGTGSRAQEVDRRIGMGLSAGYRCLGFLRAAPEVTRVDPERILGELDGLRELLERTQVDEVIVALPLDGLYQTVGKLVALCREFGVQVRASADYLAEAGAEPGAPVTWQPHAVRQHWTERILDVSIALAGLVVFAPALAFTALAIKATSSGPVFMRQGNGEPGQGVLRFRCTYVDRERELTPVGAALANTLISRLPRLVDVVRGEISLRASRLFGQAAGRDAPLRS